MIPMTLKEITDAVQGRLITALPETAEVGSVDTDSRRIQPGALFVAIRGERFDGNDFVETAFAAGAVAALCERAPETAPEGRAYILVADAHLALKQLAMHYRAKFHIPFIAVTGSVGKTTAKDMIAAVLSQSMTVLKTDQNLNNDIGLPLMIFRLTPEHQIAVLEMGMNHPGEIAYLAEIVKPQLAVITNIGDAHIEHLGSREAILAAKCEVLDYLKPGGALILNGDDELLRPLKEQLADRFMTVLLCGESEDCDLRATGVDASSGSEVTFEMALKSGASVPMKVPFPGKHMIYPALFATAAALGFGLHGDQICAGICGFKPSKMRMNAVELCDGSVLLDDTYNANPQSMAAAIEVLATRSAEKRIAVLGDMLELGELSELFHRKVGELCAEKGIDLVLTTGEGGAFIAEAAGPAGKYCKNKMQIAAALVEAVTPGSAVLVKASRGMHFEEVTAFIAQQFEK